MEIVDYLLARKKAGGSDVTIEQLSVTENGTYSEQGIAYSPVVVDVPAPENSYQLKDVPSGTISTIEDGTDLPMSSLKVGIEPVQDLHGYDHPWAGGAGKNLFPQQNIEGVTSVLISGLNITPGTYTLSAVVTSADTDDSLCLIIINETASNRARIDRSTNRTSTTFTTDATITSLRIYASVSYALSTGDAFSFKDIQIEKGSTATSYEPYSNICPISGWTAANVTRTGKNFADVIIDGYVPSISNGQLVQANGARTDYIPILPSETYTLQVSIATWTLYLFYYDENKNFIRYTNGTGVLTGITPSNAKYAMVRISGDYTIGTDTCQLEKGSTATTYEPYSGQTYTIQFRDGDNPLTVYGGTLDVTSGELVVDRVSVDMGDLSWFNLDNFNGVYRYRANIDNMKTKDIRSMAIVCSCYKTNIGGEPYSDGTIYNMPSPNSFAVASSYSSIAEFINSLSGQTAVYELATPTTYHLTPAQVRTLVGNNNIWADTGDVLSGKYFKEL